MMFYLDSYNSTNIQITKKEIPEVLNNFKNSEVNIVQFGGVCSRVYGQEFDFVITKYQIILWTNTIDELTINFDELAVIYKDELGYTLQLQFDSNIILVIEKV